MADVDKAADASADFAVGTWRLVLFFLFILVIDTVWELTDEKVTHSLLHCGRKGLIHAWEKIKFEIMALGLVSLILLVIEEFLFKICVDNRDKPVDADIISASHASAERHLLAAKYVDTCPDGKEQLWSSGLMHKIHVLIFLIAVSHVLYALLSLGISILSLQRFQAFERTAKQGLLEPLPVEQLQREDENRIMFGIRQTIRQFTHPMDRHTYIALRRLFFERVKLDESYNFTNFVTEFLMEEFASVVNLEWLMWGIALVWIAFPEEAYAGIWMTGAFVVLSVAAGAKLQTIAMHLARQAYSLYYVAVEAAAPDDSSSDSSVIAAQGASPDPGGHLTANSSAAPSCTTGTPSGGAVRAGSKPARGCALPRPSKALRTAQDHTQPRNHNPPAAPLQGGPHITTSNPANPTNPEYSDNQQHTVDLTAGLPKDRTATNNSKSAEQASTLLHGKQLSSPKPCKQPARVKPLQSVKFKELFWFKRPRLMLVIFQYAYFENSLALSILMFAFWKQEYSMIGGSISGTRDKTGFTSSSIAAGLVLLALDVALLVHSSWFVLPMHALTAASVPFSTPQALLEVAKARNMRLDLVHFIEDNETVQGLIRDSASAEPTQDGRQQPAPTSPAANSTHATPHRTSAAGCSGPPLNNPPKRSPPVPRGTSTKFNPVYILDGSQAGSAGGTAAATAGVASTGFSPASLSRARLARMSCPIMHTPHAHSRSASLARISQGVCASSQASEAASEQAVREIRVGLPRMSLQRGSVGQPRRSLQLHRGSVGAASLVSDGGSAGAAPPEATPAVPARGAFSRARHNHSEQRSAFEEMIEAMAQARLNELQSTPEGACAVDIALLPEHSAQRMGLSPIAEPAGAAAVDRHQQGAHQHQHHHQDDVQVMEYIS